MQIFVKTLTGKTIVVHVEVGKSLFDYNIKKNPHIFLVGRLRGGTSQAPINMETPERKKRVSDSGLLVVH